MMVLGGFRAELPQLVRLASLLPIASIRDLQRLGKKLHRYGKESMDRYRLQMMKISPSEVKPTFFTKMLVVGKCRGLSDYDIEVEAGNLIVAGSDTTEVTLTYLIWAVLKDAQVLQTLVSGAPDRASRFPKRRPEETAVLVPSDRRNAEAVLCRAGFASSHRPECGLELAGHFIPEKIIVSAQAYTLHRDPLVFHDPHSFNPERWEHPTPAMKEAFQPWGARISSMSWHKRCDYGMTAGCCYILSGMLEYKSCK